MLPRTRRPPVGPDDTRVGRHSAARVAGGPPSPRAARHARARGSRLVARAHVARRVAHARGGRGAAPGRRARRARLASGRRARRQRGACAASRARLWRRLWRRLGARARATCVCVAPCATPRHARAPCGARGVRAAQRERVRRLAHGARTISARVAAVKTHFCVARFSSDALGVFDPFVPVGGWPHGPRGRQDVLWSTYLDYVKKVGIGSAKPSATAKFFKGGLYHGRRRLPSSAVAIMPRSSRSHLLSCPGGRFGIWRVADCSAAMEHRGRWLGRTTEARKSLRTIRAHRGAASEL